MKVIFDLDGTLCDISHRLHHIKGEKKDYDAFHAACVDDVPKPEIAKVLAALASQEGEGWDGKKWEVEIWSGRSDIVRKETERWLLINVALLTSYIKLKMRPHGDHTPDHKLKRKWLHEATVKPDLVFEDRQRVVDMWREEGITCCQVAAWEE